MKKVSCLILLTALNLSAFAQTPPTTNVHFGENVRMSLKTFFFNMHIIGKDETGVYGIHVPPTEIFGKANLGGTRDFHLVHYDQGTLDNPEAIKMTFDGERNYEFATQAGNQIYVFTSSHSRKDRKTFLFAQAVIKNPFGLSSDVKKIAEIDWSRETPYERSTFGFAFSPDKSKLMIRYGLIGNNDQVLQFGVCAFNSSMQPLWQSDLKIPASEETVFNFQRFYIDNKGNVYLVGRVFDSKWDLKLTNHFNNKILFSGEPMADRAAIYTYHVIAYTNKGKTVSDFVLREPGKFITDLNVSVDRAQDIILAGFYGKEGTVSVIGAFSMKVKANSNEITNKIFHVFEKDFLLKNLPDEDAKTIQEKIAAGQEFDKYRYRMGDIQFHDNGTFSMVAEQYIEEIRTIGGGTQTATEDHFYDDNVIIITYSPDGTLAWKQKIEKFQFTKHISRHFYSSYALLSNKNKMYLVFNEFPPNKPQRSSAIMVKVNEDGSVERETLFSAEDQKVLQPVTYKITGEKEMYIFGIEGKMNYSLIRLNFN